MKLIRLGYCFWCEKLDVMTKDHVIPACFGGREIVMACFNCNNERGNVLSYACQLKNRNTKRKRYKRPTKWLNHFNRIKELHVKWSLIEKEKIGYSPTGRLQIYLPRQIGNKLRKKVRKNPLGQKGKS